ncbi:major facilitator superfamily MFS_1 [Candidatus Vecturithrix granuli]|uniref:Major facilitator superfamily MFS_1 n=1 Tax=Vecturithrix granuli TaxID=1499967 RepID=A0A081BW30_VECG1|nr:major facilitator superfamily MFS_1 [Candidatus Vecturithrix granuli]
MKAFVENRISMSKKLAYAAPAFALAVVGIPIYVYLPKFYSDVVGVNIAIIGSVLLGVRIFDAITDPLLGFLSDKTHSRFGRRRPYIAIGSIFLAIAIYLLFNPPDASTLIVTVWFTAGIFSLFLFWTIVVVPYESLGPEISMDYHERTTLFGLRDGLLIAGTLAAASSPAIIAVVFKLASDPAGERAKFFWISVLYAPLVIVGSWWCVAAIQERPRTEVTSGDGLLTGLRHVIRNKPFMILLISYTISAVGNNLPATLILYYVEYVLQSSRADFFLLLYFVTGILFLPGWITLSRHVGKKMAWLSSMALNTGAFIGVFFLGPGDAAMYGVLVFLSGIGFGATVAIPSAIQADVIDYDELLSGERREGQYIGLWSISKKIAAALGVGIALSILGLVGYAPNVEQTSQVQLTLRILYSLAPSLCNMIAFFIALKYPITGKIHENIRLAIRERQAGRPVVDPLHPERMVT